MEQWQSNVNKEGVEHVLKAHQPLYVQPLKITKDETIIFVIFRALDFVSKMCVDQTHM